MPGGCMACEEIAGLLLKGALTIAGVAVILYAMGLLQG